MEKVWKTCETSQWTEWSRRLGKNVRYVRYAKDNSTRTSHPAEISQDPAHQSKPQRE